jgi:hypothetical protein
MFCLSPQTSHLRLVWATWRRSLQKGYWIASHPTRRPLKREQLLVWTFDFGFGLEEFFTPWFAYALGALVDRIANRETVIARSFGAVARKLATGLAGLEELAFERSMLLPEFVFTDDAHDLLPTADLFSATILADETLLQ